MHRSNLLFLLPYLRMSGISGEQSYPRSFASECTSLIPRQSGLRLAVTILLQLLKHCDYRCEPLYPACFVLGDRIVQTGLELMVLRPQHWMSFSNGIPWDGCADSF